MNARSLKTRITQLVACDHPCVTNAQGDVLDDLTYHLKLGHRDRQEHKANKRLVLANIVELVEEGTITVECHRRHPHVIYRILPVLAPDPHEERRDMTAPPVPDSPAPVHWPPLMAQYRDMILGVLIREGGRIEDPEGQVRTRILKLLGLPDENNERDRLSAVFTLMEKAGLIIREINGRRTNSMQLGSALSAEERARLEAAVRPSTPATPSWIQMGSKPTLEECFQIVCVLALSRRPNGRLDDDNGYATRLLLAQAGFPCSYTPNTLTSALTSLDRRGLIHRHVEGGRCSEIELVGHPLSEDFLQSFRFWEKAAAERVREHLRPQPVTSTVATTAPLETEAAPAEPPEQTAVAKAPVVVLPTTGPSLDELAVTGSQETDELLVFVLRKDQVPERQAGLHGELLTIIDALQADRAKLLQRLSTQDAETAQLKQRVEGLEEELRRAADELELARDPSVAKAQSLAAKFRSGGLEGLMQ